MMLYEAPENIDLIMCLKEIALVLRANPEDVPKVKNYYIPLKTAIAISFTRIIYYYFAIFK